MLNDPVKTADRILRIIGWLKYIRPFLERHGVMRPKPYTVSVQGGTFERKWATRRELQRDKVEQRTVRVFDLLNGESICDKIFNNCTIIGPAILWPVEDWPIHDCLWDMPRWEMFQSAEDTYPQSGAIRTKGCQFNHCVFEGIPFRMKRSEIDRVKRDFNGDS